MALLLREIKRESPLMETQTPGALEKADSLRLEKAAEGQGFGGPFGQKIGPCG
jgi:hypothetical protein